MPGAPRPGSANGGSDQDEDATSQRAADAERDCLRQAEVSFEVLELRHASTVATPSRIAQAQCARVVEQIAIVRTACAQSDMIAGLGPATGRFSAPAAKSNRCRQPVELLAQVGTQYPPRVRLLSPSALVARLRGA
jgi:hypothetical protein